MLRECTLYFSKITNVEVFQVIDQAKIALTLVKNNDTSVRAWSCEPVSCENRACEPRAP